MANCEGTFDTNGQTLNTPNYPSNYGANEHCTWKLEAPPGKHVRLLQFSYELEGVCGFDNLKIYDGDTTSHNVIADLCATNGTQDDIESTGTTLLLHFTTDGSKQFLGFRIYYEKERMKSKYFLPLIITPEFKNTIWIPY